MRADGGFWHMGLNSSRQLLAQEGQEENSEGRGPQQRREQVGVAGSDD